MFALRQAVFVVEQNCPFQDIDGKDVSALHLLGWQGDTLVATLRLFPEFPDYDGRISIGRVCCSRDLRGQGLGIELMREAIGHIDRDLPDRETQIGAQLYLKRFYEIFGFSQCSDVYVEDDIDHILMRRPPQSITN